MGIPLYSLENRPIGDSLLALYRWALQAGLLVVNQRMTETTYLNISMLAADCGDVAWAATFNQAWKSYLDDHAMEDAFQTASSYLLFAKGEFDGAQEILVRMAANRLPYSLITRWVMLKIAFEQFLKDRGLYEYLLHHAAAFEKFIPYQALGETKQTAWLNFVRFTRKLASLRLKTGRASKAEKQQLEAELEALNYVFSKKWLLEKIEAL